MTPVYLNKFILLPKTESVFNFDSSDFFYEQFTKHSRVQCFFFYKRNTWCQKKKSGNNLYEVSLAGKV